MDTRHESGCTVCTAPTADAIYLCRAHQDTLVEVLRGVPGLVTDLDVTITRQNRTVSERHGGRSSSTPLPWNEHAAVAASDLASALNAATMTVARVEQDERDRLTAIGAYDTANLARWLGRNIGTLRRIPEAGDIFLAVDDAIRVARRATDRPPEQVLYGRCDAVDAETGSECGGALYGRRGASHVRCACGTRHDTAVCRDVMLSRCRNLRGTAPQLASWLLMFGVTATAGAVRAKAARKRFPVVARAGGSPLYRLVDVVDAYAGIASKAPS